MKKYTIIPIPILPFRMVNAYLICNESGCILLDTGIPNSEEKILRGLKKVGFDFSHIKLTVITHAHMDHAGSASAIRKLSKAPVIAHRNDLKYLRGEAEVTYCPTGLVGKLFYHTPLPHQKYEHFTPDLIMNEGDLFPLDEFGFEGGIAHTPGHTAGSLSLDLKGGEIFVGDLVASGILIGGVINNKKPRQPPFEEDARTVAETLRQMLRKNHEVYYPGHGDPLHSPQIRQHIANLERKCHRER